MLKRHSRDGIPLLHPIECIVIEKSSLNYFRRLWKIIHHSGSIVRMPFLLSIYDAYFILQLVLARDPKILEDFILSQAKMKFPTISSEWWWANSFRNIAHHIASIQSNELDQLKTATFPKIIGTAHSLHDETFHHECMVWPFAWSGILACLVHHQRPIDRIIFNIHIFSSLPANFI